MMILYTVTILLGVRIVLATLYPAMSDDILGTQPPCHKVGISNSTLDD